MHRFAPLLRAARARRPALARGASLALAAAALAVDASAQAIEQGALVPPAPNGDLRFGDAIAVDGDLMVVGAPGNPGYPQSTGQARVYRWDPVDAEWDYEQTLVSSTPELDGQFGIAVAIEGDVIAVTARYEDSPNAVDAGAVHVFRGGRIAGGTWTHEQKLTSATGGTNEEFGHGIALHDELLLVGAPYATTVKGVNSGVVHTFAYDSGSSTWNEGAQLIDPDGDSYDYAGFSVAFDGTTALVGAPGESTTLPFSNQGSVSIWTLGTFNWTHSLELRSTSTLVEEFGYAVALDGVDLVVGAPSHDAPGAAGTGAVHFFTFHNGSWQPRGTVVNPALGNYVHFGREVALEGSTALAGTGGLNRAFSFRKGKFQKGWFFDQELGASDKVWDDQYGSAVAISDERLMIGASAQGGVDAGKVYLFDADELNLSITPTQPAPGQLISVSVYDGTPGDPLLLVVDEIDGIPTWIVLAADVFDAQHRFEFDVFAENPLLGFNVGVMAWKLSPTGPVVGSEKVHVDL